MKRLLVLSMAAAIAAPVFAAPQIASAQSYESCREQQRRSANKGTLVGGLGGALLGGTVAGNGAKTEGAVLGGVVGAVAGHQIAKKNAKCSTYPRRATSRSSQAAPRRVSANSSRKCRVVQEYYGGRNHSYQVCRDRDGVWRPA